MHASHWFRVVGFVVAVVAVAGRVDAQPVVVLNGSSFASGPDYASDVLQDAWDFSNPEDIAPDPDQMLNWTTPDAATIRTLGTGAAFLSGGWFRGQPATDSNVTLLYRADALAINPGRSGARFPIETARFGKLAVKMRVTGAPVPNNVTAYWFHASLLEPNFTNRGGGRSLAPLAPAGSSEQIYVFDLAQAGGVLAPGAPWAAEPAVKSLRLDPLDGAAQAVEIDWVRLTPSNNQPGAALMPVTLQGCSGFQSFTVIDAGGTSSTITDVVGANPSLAFNYGIFPPGNYQLRATCGNGSSALVSFSINTRPIVTVLNPDEAGDPATDYALVERGGNRWDFNELTDVARVFNVNTTGGACTTPQGGPCGIVPATPPGVGTMFRASSIDLGPGTAGDPGVEMLNGAVVPLNSRRHRSLSFTLGMRRPYVLNAVFGPVARVLWSSAATGDALSMTVSQDIRIWPGLNRYTVDLGTLATTNGGIETECLPTCPTIPWLTRAIRHLRVDPHEYNDAPTSFDLDEVTLTSPDEVALGQTFTISYAFTDPDAAGATYTARLYRESWPNRTNRVLLATLPGVVPGAVLTYSLNPFNLGMAPGEYTISVEVDEVRGGTLFQTSRGYATGALLVSNPAASVPRVSVSTPTPNQNVPIPFTIQGCAFDEGTATGGINVDDIAVRMRAIAGPRTGAVLSLGFESAYPGTGTLQFGPLGSPVACPSAGGVYAQSGFRVINIGAGTADYLYGTWMIDVWARSTISGEMIQLNEIPVQIGPVAPAGPVNFQASAVGNTVTVSWQAPGPGIAYYQIQGATNPSFSPLAFQLDLPGTGPYSGQLASGTYYLRVYARTTGGVWTAPSATQVLNVALPQPPGPPTLVPAQVATNPVTLNWATGPGGTPESYTLYAGTSPGASNLAVAPMGVATSISAVAPGGVPIYVRVIATNAAGSATSNEIVFSLAPPAAPTLSPATLSGRNVTLGWSAVANATSYTVVARYPGSPAVIATLPVGGTTIAVPAPPGAYRVSVVATNSIGSSAESNLIDVVVP